MRWYLQNKPGDVDFNDAAALQVHLGILRRAELQEYMNVLETEVHIIKLGNIAFASNPFELFLDYGNQIRARSKAESPLLSTVAIVSSADVHTAFDTSTFCPVHSNSNWSDFG